MTSSSEGARSDTARDTGPEPDVRSVARVDRQLRRAAGYSAWLRQGEALSVDHPGDRSRDDQLLQRYSRTRDDVLLEQLVARWMPLARQLARRYGRSSEPFEDLLQVASMGLVKALQGYDPDRGKAFSSYAVPTIMGELKRYFRDRTWSVRMPRSLQELAMRVEAARDRLAGEHGHVPSVGELAAATGATEEEVLEALQAGDAYHATSLEAQRSDEEDTYSLGDMLGEADDGFRLAEHRVLLTSVIGELSERDREILRLRFEEDLTQQQIASIIGVSQMQVSRLLRRSLATLRAAADRAPEPLRAVA
jgi:RNA polymerase sigma-B factor